jgi:hypothetical protein
MVATIAAPVDPDAPARGAGKFAQRRVVQVGDAGFDGVVKALQAQLGCSGSLVELRNVLALALAAFLPPGEDRGEDRFQSGGDRDDLFDAHLAGRSVAFQGKPIDQPHRIGVRWVDLQLLPGLRAALAKKDLSAAAQCGNSVGAKAIIMAISGPKPSRPADRGCAAAGSQA